MKEGDAMHRQVLYVLPILIAGTAQAAAIPELSTHQARYEMDLLSATQDSQMTSIKGKVKFEIKNDCNGWISSEDYLLEFGYGSGDSAIIVSHFESWEDKTGNLYSFEVHEGSAMSLKNSLWAMRHEMRPQQETKPLIRLPLTVLPACQMMYISLFCIHVLFLSVLKGRKAVLCQYLFRRGT